jgi:hypothetical protein
MKNLIKSTALFLLLSAGIFVTPVRAAAAAHPVPDQVFFSTLNKQFGVSVSVLKPDAGKTTVAIYDEDNHLLIKDSMNRKDFDQKGYILDELDNGNYSIEVVSNGELITKTVHIYEEGNTKKILFI